MKQDLEGQKLFRQIVDETLAELKTQLRFSDSIAEKIDGILKERGMSQRELAKSQKRPQPRFRVGSAVRTILHFAH